jgi:hypothetical protein
MRRGQFGVAVLVDDDIRFTMAWLAHRGGQVQHAAGAVQVSRETSEGQFVGYRPQPLGSIVIHGDGRRAALSRRRCAGRALAHRAESA